MMFKIWHCASISEKNDHTLQLGMQPLMCRCLIDKLRHHFSFVQKGSIEIASLCFG